jgi:PAS domain S-box-containing protein
MSKPESFMLPAKFWRTVAQFSTGSIALALVTAVCFRIQVNPTSVTLLYLIVIVLVSLTGDFFPSALVSFLAILFLDYFFTPPLFSLAMSQPLDVVATVAFLTTSAVITHLVSSLQSSAEELRRRETYLAEAQRLSHTGSFRWSVVSEEVYWSDETFRIFEYDRAAKPSLELVLQRVHPDDRALVQQINDRASNDGTNFNTEYRLLMPDGAIKYLHVVAHVLQDQSGNLEFVGAMMDITANKQAEEALRRSEEQWRDVFENNPTMYFMVDAAGKVMAVNQFGAEQLGYTANQLVGKPVLNVFCESDREAVQRNFALCLKELGRARNWEARKVRRDGEVLWVRETAKAVPRLNGPIVLIACEDITEKKRAEEALNKAQADLAHVSRVTTMGELVASIAHEVNQPLGAIVTNGHACVHLLSREVPDLDKAREVIGRMISDGMRASEVIKRIRDLLRKTPPEKAPLNINEPIQEVIALVSSDVLRSRVKLFADLASDLPPVIGDRVQLQQVILNLILNAKDAMSAVQTHPHELLITSRKSKSGEVVVAVRDSGKGLEPGDADRIFDPFFSTKPEGMGLGLSISRTIIEDHHGTLWATPNEDKGATIQFALPAGNGREL